MRDFKGMKRQRGRNRNGGGGGGGGGKPQHNTNRAFDSNGPEGVKVRGAAQHVYEKYQQLARDAHTAGDRVLAENYLQHAEHYFRTMRAMQPQRPISEIIGRDQFVSGYDIDFEDESGGDQGEQETEPETNVDGGENGRMEGRRDGRDDYRQGDTRGRDDRSREERFQGERSQGDRVQADRSQNERSQRPFREDRPRFNREERSPRFERQDRDPLGVIEPEATPLTTSPVESASMLRADDGDVSHAPAFLQVRPAEPRSETDEEPRRPRRRRAPRTFEGAEAAETPVEAEEG
jgi:Domain of unknown function (DUF4167)